MKNALVVGSVLLFAAVLFWGTTRATPPAASTAATAAEAGFEPVSLPADDGKTVQFYRDPATVPALELTTVDGRKVTANRGKVTIVNFWATWCPPCRAEVPDLVALQAKYADDLQIIGISEDEEGPAVVKAFMAEHKINYPIVMSDERIREVFPGVGALPTSYIIDRDGRIMQRHIGLLSAPLTERETRALAGLDPSLTVEYVDPAKPIGLTNEAQVSDIPGVDLASLPPAKRTEALKRLNTEGCTCGCGLTVARCRVDDPSCGVSLPAARKIVSEIASQ